MEQRMVGEEITLRVIGQQRLEIEVLHDDLRRANSQLVQASQHECAPSPCTRECCVSADLGGSANLDGSADLE